MNIQQMNNTKTTAFPFPRELFRRLKDHLAQKAARTGCKICQPKFIITLIE